MRYKVQQKQFLVFDNKIFNPDNFGSWRIINYGTNPLIINDTITLAQNESYSVELQPYVIFDTVINLKFDTTTAGSNRAAMILFYVKPI
jgi:hypothetical protein